VLKIPRTVFFFCALSGLCQTVRGSSTVSYDVTLDTAPLVGHAAGPFYIQLAFTDGSGVNDANNTVTISNASFGGGSALGSPLAFGGAGGSLQTGIAITDSSFLSVFIEQFAPGLQLRFSLGLTLNDDAGPIPDGLTLTILDSSGVPLPTLAPGGDYFLGAELHSTGTIFSAYGSDPSRAPSVGNPITIGSPTIQFLAKQVKGAERDTLLALLPTGDPEVDEQIHGAIRHIDASLAPKLWADEQHLTPAGERVFDEEERAVDKVGEIRRVPASLLSELRDVPRTLALVDRALAQTALDEARLAGGEGDDLARVQEDLARGDKLSARGKFDDAIEHYKDAWIDARRAMDLDTDHDHRGADDSHLHRQ
jgi:hypothetical protein